jgi:hypothetical protein
MVTDLEGIEVTPEHLSEHSLDSGSLGGVAVVAGSLGHVEWLCICVCMYLSMYIHTYTILGGVEVVAGSLEHAKWLCACTRRYICIYEAWIVAVSVALP